MESIAFMFDEENPDGLFKEKSLSLSVLGFLYISLNIIFSFIFSFNCLTYLHKEYCEVEHSLGLQTRYKCIEKPFPPGIYGIFYFIFMGTVIVCHVLVGLLISIIKSVKKSIKSHSEIQEIKSKLIKEIKT